MLSAFLLWLYVNLWLQKKEDKGSVDEECWNVPSVDFLPTWCYQTSLEELDLKKIQRTIISLSCPVACNMTS